MLKITSVANLCSFAPKNRNNNNNNGSMNSNGMLRPLQSDKVQFGRANTAIVKKTLTVGSPDGMHLAPLAGLRDIVNAFKNAGITIVNKASGDSITTKSKKGGFQEVEPFDMMALLAGKNAKMEVTCDAPTFPQVGKKRVIQAIDKIIADKAPKDIPLKKWVNETVVPFVTGKQKAL